MKHAFPSLDDPGTEGNPFWDNEQVLADVAKPKFVTMLGKEINDSHIVNVSLKLVACRRGGREGRGRLLRLGTGGRGERAGGPAIAVHPLIPLPLPARPLTPPRRMNSEAGRGGGGAGEALCATYMLMIAEVRLTAEVCVAVA